MQRPTDPVVILSDDPSFSTALQHHLEEKGHATTVQRSDTCTPDTLAAQHPGLVVVHAAGVEHASLPADTLVEQVQLAPGIENVPVIVCADHRALREELVKQLGLHRGAVVASSCQTGEVCAKLHELDASSMQS